MVDHPLVRVVRRAILLVLLVLLVDIVALIIVPVAWRANICLVVVLILVILLVSRYIPPCLVNFVVLSLSLCVCVVFVD